MSEADRERKVGQHPSISVPFHAQERRWSALACCIQNAVSACHELGLVRLSPWVVPPQPLAVYDAGSAGGSAFVLTLLELHLVGSGLGLFECPEWTRDPAPGCAPSIVPLRARRASLILLLKGLERERVKPRQALLGLAAPYTCAYCLHSCRIGLHVCSY